MVTLDTNNKKIEIKYTKLKEKQKLYKQELEDVEKKHQEILTKKSTELFML